MSVPSGYLLTFTTHEARAAKRRKLSGASRSQSQLTLCCGSHRALGETSISRRQAAGARTVQSDLANRGDRIRRHNQRAHAQRPALPDGKDEASRSHKKPSRRGGTRRHGFFFCFSHALATVSAGFQPEFQLLKNGFLQRSHTRKDGKPFFNNQNLKSIHKTGPDGWFTLPTRYYPA
jgi:hypothetical protein